VIDSESPMGRLHLALREAVVLVAISASLGFAYTFITDRGFFSPTFVSSSVSTDQRAIPIDSVRHLYQVGAALFIDSRRASEFDAGRIPGAMSLPADAFDIYKVQFEAFPRTQPIIVYCDGQQCNSSLTVATRLNGLGFTNVRVFFGGWQEWNRSGLPVEGAGK
jgi:rhodanese-related sulfurtransferase